MQEKKMRGGRGDVRPGKGWGILKGSSLLFQRLNSLEVSSFPGLISKEVSSSSQLRGHSGTRLPAARLRVRSQAALVWETMTNQADGRGCWGSSRSHRPGN